MRRIINGRKFDTETAKPVGTFEESCIPSDFHWYMETLYQKRSGAFFLYGEGNARSPYATRHSDGMWGPGKEISPLAYEDAQKWAEAHLTADEYEKIFGQVEDDGEEDAPPAKIRFTTYVSAETYRTLSATAAKETIGRGAVIDRLVAAAKEAGRLDP